MGYGDIKVTNKIHFIAIGGIGMSGLAKFMIEKGWEVSGSDLCDSKYAHQLTDMGAKVYIGHDAKNVPEGAVVVASTAISPDNPELLRAKQLGLRIYHRSDLLAKIANDTPCFIGFSGTHGKTTSSGLCSYVLEKSGFNPSFVVGGIVPELHTNAQAKNGLHFVAELDESDGTIVKYLPKVAVINNIEADHVDFYKNGITDVIKTFKIFATKLPEDSKILLNVDDEGVCALKEQIIGGDVYTYSIGGDADFVASNVNFFVDYTTFDVYYKNSFVSEFKIILKGIHNVYNALGVIGALYLSGVDVASIRAPFETFTGMGRRFEKVGSLTHFVKADIYDDYAHHPTEIRATLLAACSFHSRRVVAVFQPHRYTRLQSLWKDFEKALSIGAGLVVVTDVFAASETPIQGITGANFANAIGAKHIAGDMKTVARKLMSILRNGDIVVGMGAGTITELGKELLALDGENIKFGN